MSSSLTRQHMQSGPCHEIVIVIIVIIVIIIIISIKTALSAVFNDSDNLKLVEIG